jgi:hypothetical protein
VDNRTRRSLRAGTLNQTLATEQRGLAYRGKPRRLSKLKIRFVRSPQIERLGHAIVRT